MNPWLIIGFLVALILTGLGSCSYGKHQGEKSCQAAAGKQLGTTKAAQDARDVAIDAGAGKARADADAAVLDTRINTNESIERIRTVVVSGACRDIDPVIVREHTASQQRINAKIRSGVRPDGAGAAQHATGN